MYTPEPFAEPSIEVMHQLMRDYPLATLVTLADDALTANPIPLELSLDPLPWGSLRGHMARANPVWQQVSPTQEVLVIFHGPNAYISPSWYAAKAETGKVVPTWNYALVHAYGFMRVYNNPQWLLQHLETMTTRQEAGFPTPWCLADAPVDFISSLLPAIVGIEISITRLEGKRKLSQNRSVADRKGVAAGLFATGRADAMAIAGLIEFD